MKLKRIFFSLILLIVVLLLRLLSIKKSNFNPTKTIGHKLDSINGVYVFYNGGVDNSLGRNLSKEGYNFGLKYQCVEFVKRYYFLALKHKMPNTYGHAKDFFNPKLVDGKRNEERNLLQFINGSKTIPKVNDLLVFSASTFNKHGHVAIVSKVAEDSIEIIQQNAGPFSSSRETFQLIKEGNKFKIKNNRILGWLRKS